MGAWGLPAWDKGGALARQFAILSLIVIGLITAALCVVISNHLRESLLEREWGTTADFIRTEAVQNLAPSDFATPESEAAQRRLRGFYEQAVVMPEIVRVKIYDSAMRVIWSDEPRLIGARFPDNPQLIRALAGHTTVNLKTGGKKGEHLYEQDERQLVEVYVPIVFSSDSGVVGVVETYKEPAQVFANIRRGQVTVIATALAGGALLYLSLFWIVRRAGRRIETQHQTLERQSREVAAANQELRQVQAQLVEAERMAAIGEVVAAVAHGMRNPLANIRASAQVSLLDCRECETTTMGPRNLANIIAEVDRLEGRFRDLLHFVRPAERLSRSLDLNAVLRAALQSMAGRMSEARVKAEERLAPALPVIIGDALLLEQVFTNLIGNAIEASPEGGIITLTTGPEGALGIFAEIEDTGTGIPPEQIAKVFDLFYTTKAQGTGLGLAIVRKFTEAHGGAIAVRSQPGHGATFRVTLPVEPKA